MAQRDPAFLFYPGDASEDTQFMNRLERGCYFDILKAQKKFERFTLEIIKKVLGADFENCWPAIKSILKEDEAGFFIEWADNSIERRKEFSKIQSERITNYHNKKRNEQENVTAVEPSLYRGSTGDLPLENEIENEIENRNEKGKENETAHKGVQGEIFDQIVSDWNVYADKNAKPKIRGLNSERKRKLKIRLLEPNFDFREILRKANSSVFIRDGTWFSFDWTIESEKNYLKILEGNYNQNGSGITGAKPATGGNVDMQSAFAKLSLLPD